MNYRIKGLILGPFGRATCPRCKKLATQDFNTIVLSYYENEVHKYAYIGEMVTLPCCNIEVPVPQFFCGDTQMADKSHKLMRSFVGKTTQEVMDELVLVQVPNDLIQSLQIDTELSFECEYDEIRDDNAIPQADPMDFQYYDGTKSTLEN